MGGTTGMIQSLPKMKAKTRKPLMLTGVLLSFSLSLLSFSLTLLMAGRLHAAQRNISLEQGFLHPPASARPWIFWFWLNGNITSNGITADLEAMQRVGIGGVIIMDVDQGVPQGPIAFGRPEWINLYKHVCGEANRLGLQVNMNDDAGWAGSGGPWIPPELSMQKLVWSETTVKGPSRFEGVLPQPKTVTNYYRDIAVFALPVSEAETTKMKDFSPKFSAIVMDKDFDPKKLWDGDEKSMIRLPRPEVGKPQYVQIEFAEPFRARRLKLTLPGLSIHKMCQGALQISEDGRDFKTIGEFDADASAVSINFNETASRFFRVEFSNPEWYLEHLDVAEVELSSEFRIDDIETKASFIANKEKSTGTNAIPNAPPPAIGRKQL